jgi:hypothetical protein
MKGDKTLLEIFRRIIWTETRWLRHYLAQVVNVTDSDNRGQVRVICFDLGYTSEDNGLWCSPRNKNGLITPKVGDWVEIYFMGGDKNRPVFIGQANDMEGMLPKNYDGKATTQVLFEDGENKIRQVFDALANEMKIGNSGFSPCARKDDTTKLTLSGIDIQTLAVALLTTGGFVPASAPVPASVSVTFTNGKITSGSNQVSVGAK